MTRAAAPKLGAYAGLTALGLLAALALGRPELVVLAAPFALALAAGLALARTPQLEARVTAARERAIEGDEIEVELELAASTPVERLELLLVLPPGLGLAGDEKPLSLRLRAGERRALQLRLRCERWGAYIVGEVLLRARDPLGLLRYEGRFGADVPLRVYPRSEALRVALQPVETQASAGNEVSRRKGDGIEFADMRPFGPGDRLRAINWRASARRGELWVNERHPERNTDVVLFLDTFGEARDETGGTLDLAVRAAGSLLDLYLGRKDRVGLVSFGGILRWLVPGTGLAQLYRVLDSLLDTEIVFSYAWKDIDIIPTHTLPPKALVIALTPLLDERSAGALLDLRRRGFDLAVVEVSPVPFARPGGGELERVAHRLWRLRRDALRARYEEAGVAVAEWRAGQPLAQPLGEVRGFRRHARFARA